MSIRLLLTIKTVVAPNDTCTIHERALLQTVLFVVKLTYSLIAHRDAWLNSGVINPNLELLRYICAGVVY